MRVYGYKRAQFSSSTYRCHLCLLYRRHALVRVQNVHLDSDLAPEALDGRAPGVSRRRAEDGDGRLLTGHARVGRAAASEKKLEQVAKKLQAGYRQ